VTGKFCSRPDPPIKRVADSRKPATRILPGCERMSRGTGAGIHRAEHPKASRGSGVRYLPMPNIAHFMIPADDVQRAKRFYHTLLGWKIGPTKNPMDPSVMAALQYQDISTGPAQEGTLNTGGLYKRHMKEPILTFVEVGEIDKVLAKVEKLGGRIVRQKEEIKGVGLTAMIQDTEGNVIGLWKPEMV
jgi:predicted enzyme related to lactoylglutathione lyase